MSEQVGSVTRKKSSDFHGGIRFQSSFTIRWELEDKNFLKIDIICLDDSLKYRIMAIKTNENFIPQVAQARNMSIGEHRHCCVTFKI